MIKKKESIPDKSISRLQCLVNILLLNAGFIESIGLGKGKLGIAIFFYHYARYTGSKLYEEFADSLLDEVSDQLNTSTPLDFENGLTGIGWGIVYLVKNSFIEGDIDEILNDIDIAIADKLNEYLPEERDRNERESGYYLYQQAKGQNKNWNDKEIISFVKPQNDNNVPLSVPVLINPDNYGLFEGFAGESLVILKELNELKEKKSG